MFKNIRHQIAYYWRIYKRIVGMYVNLRLGYRLDFFVGFFGMLIKSVSGIITLSIIFSNVPQIQGWSYYDLLFMYGLSSIAVLPVEIFFSNVWNLHNHIIQGTFVKFCLKPLNVMFFYFSEVVEFKSFMQLFISIPIIVIAGRKMDIQWTPLLVGTYLIYYICSSLIIIAIYIMSASLGFWLTNSMSITNFVGQVMNFAKYPITIYGGCFKFIFSYIIPIGFVAYYPTMVLMGKVSYANLLIEIVLTGIFMALSAFVWTKGVQHYSGTGS